MAKKQIKKEPRFPKSQILNSDEFGRYRDLLQAALDEDKTYTKTEIRNLLTNLLNTEVV